MILAPLYESKFLYLVAFQLAKEKAPAIIFIDELDAIGTKRFDSEKAGDREVQRTMLELLNQLDGFEPNTNIKVCHLFMRAKAVSNNVLPFR